MLSGGDDNKRTNCGGCKVAIRMIPQVRRHLKPITMVTGFLQGMFPERQRIAQCEIELVGRRCNALMFSLALNLPDPSQIHCSS